MKTANIGFVAKDIMAFKTLLPVIRAFALRSGPIPIVFLEGLAYDECMQVSSLRAVVVKVGLTEKPERETWDEQYWNNFLQKYLIDVLVVGASAPNHAEGELARAANRLGIPVIAYPDTWGAESRLTGVKVDVWFAIDRVHAELLEKRGGAIVIIGDPAYDEIMMVHPETDRYRLARYGDPYKMIVVVGQNYAYLRDLMEAALGLLLGTPDSLLVPRLWHPKYGPDAELAKRLDALVKHYGVEGRVVRFDSDDEKHFAKKTNAIVAFADATVSAFSTTLRIAAAKRNLAVSVHSRATQEGMKSSTGLDYYPPASYQGPIYRFDKYDDGLDYVDAKAIRRGLYTPMKPDIEQAVGTILDITV